MRYFHLFIFPRGQPGVPGPPSVSKAMSAGYRTLHREVPPASSTGSPPHPLWSVKFSPCRQSGGSSTSRLLAASSDGTVHAFAVVDNSGAGGDDSSPLDATAIKLRKTHILIGKDENTKDYDVNGSTVALGCSSLDVVRNYGGSDPQAGDEVAVGMRLDGLARVWIRNEQPAASSNANTASTTVAEGDGNSDSKKPEAVAADLEFKVDKATGTTLAIRPPSLGPVHGHASSRRKKGPAPAVVCAVGCLDGSVCIVSTGVSLHVRSNDATGSGDASPTPTNTGDDGEDKNSAAQVIEAGTIHDKLGTGSAVPSSVAWSPLAATLAVGRVDGAVDLYSASSDGNGDEGQYKRMHRILCHPKPVRGLTFTADAALLVVGDDEGTLTVHDVVQPRPTAPVGLVGAALAAHMSYIMGLAPMPDGKRFISVGADGLVKVWDVGMLNSGAVHTFADGKGTGIVWSVCVSAAAAAATAGASLPERSVGVKLATTHDNGSLLIYSTEN